MICVRPYETSDAARFCEIINACVCEMHGLNEAARDLIRAKNTPEILDSELSAAYTLVAQTEYDIASVGCLAGSEIKRVYYRMLEVATFKRGEAEFQAVRMVRTLRTETG